LTDRELLARFAHNRDGDAFAELMRCHAPAAFSAAYRVLGDAHMAEDATQVAFIALAQKAARLGPQTVVAGWLYQAAMLAAQNLKRQRTRRDRYEQEAAVARAANASQIEQGTWDELRVHLDAALAELPAAQRDAVVLRCLLQRSLNECSKELGCSEEAVTMRLHRGLETLRCGLKRRKVEVTTAVLLGLTALYGVETLPEQWLTRLQDVSMGKAAATVAAAANAKGVLQTMFWITAKPYLAAGFATLAFTFAFGTVYLSHGEDAKADPKMDAPKQEDAKRTLVEGNVVKGLRTTLVVKQAQFDSKGQPALELAFKNESKEPLVLLMPFVEWGAGCLHAKVIDEKGGEVSSIPFANKFNRGEMRGGWHYGLDKHFVILKPAEEYRVELNAGLVGKDYSVGQRMSGCFACSYFQLDKVGKYRVTIEYKPPEQLRGNHQKDCWRGSVETNPVEVELTGK